MSQHPITLTGRLTETPTLSKINTDMYKVTFRVASSKRRKTDQGWNDFDPLFIGVEAWGQFAINIRASLEKGMPVVVVGSLCSSEWQDRETGQNRSRIVIKAQYVGLDLNHHVIGSKRIAVTHNLAGVNMGDTDEQEFPIDRDFTVPDSAALGDATSAENSSPAAPLRCRRRPCIPQPQAQHGSRNRRRSRMQATAQSRQRPSGKRRSGRKWARVPA